MSDHSHDPGECFKPEIEEPTPGDQPDEVTDLDALQRGSFMEKIRFAWRSEDKSILDRIEAAANEQFVELFADALTEVDNFYEALRVPRVRNGTRVVDAKGSPIWETDENGKLIERWDQLTGQDIEQILMNLQRIKMYTATQVNRLKNQAVYAKMVADDLKDESWGKVIQATQGDKTAKANRASRVDRYHAYFRYCLWSTMDCFHREIIDFVFRLKDVRYWRTQDQR